MSDLKNNLDCQFFQFSNDTLIIKPVKTVVDIDSVQRDLISFERYCDSKDLKLNESKTKHLKISLKRHRNDLFETTYQLKGFNIEQVDCHKHLGVYYDRKMSFNTHTSEIIKSSFKTFNFFEFYAKKLVEKFFSNYTKLLFCPKLSTQTDVGSHLRVNQIL